MSGIRRWLRTFWPSRYRLLTQNADTGGQCEGARRPVLLDGYAICPACGHVVKVSALTGLWRFVDHDADGVPTPNAHGDIPEAQT